MFERVLERIIREKVDVAKMQYSLTPGGGTTHAIFILHQLQEQVLHKNKQLYFVSVNLEKAFHRVPRKVLCWTMRKVGLEEQIVHLVQEIRTGSPWEMLYADGLVIVSDSLADLQHKLDAWKSAMEDKGCEEMQVRLN